MKRRVSIEMALTMFVAVMLVIIAADGCSASSRTTAIKTTLVATDAARAGFVTFDAKHQQDLVVEATSVTGGEAALKAYRADRDKVSTDLQATYRAIAAAATANDDPSAAGMVAAAALLAADLKAIGVTP